MFATQCTKFRLNKGFSHSFHPLSGWCIFGCGNREDGRIISRDGKVIEKGPHYTGEELAHLKARSEQIIAARTPVSRRRRNTYQAPVLDERGDASVVEIILVLLVSTLLAIIFAGVQVGLMVAAAS